MSSTTHSLPTSTTTEPKKKFGTNLNKLAKPPPPTSSSTSSSQINTRSSQLSSQRGGLLLLSTKRTSGVCLPSNIQSSVGRNVPKPTNTPSLRSDNLSSYDALKTGLADNDSNTATTQQMAWGVIDKPNTVQSNSKTTTLPVLAPKGLKPPAKASAEIKPKTEANNSLKLKTSDSNTISNSSRDNISEAKAESKSKQNDHMRKPISRNDRTEVRRKDDIMLENNRRTSRRHDNIPSVIIPQDIIITTETPPPPPPTIKPRPDNGKDAEIVLEVLGPKTTVKTNATEPEQKAPTPNKTVKPNKTFSSLVGGTEKKDSPSNSPPVPFIQLSSYDDRDRGQQAGPKMLFDPKSGSMIAAPSDKRAVTFTRESKPRKERPRPKSRSSRDKDTSQSVVIAKRVDLNRAKKSNDESPLEDFRGRRKAQNNPSIEQPNSIKIKAPRTCGVLYKLDDDGNYISADGCDPDQGYGSHSVPGGRTRYPSTYAKFLDQQRILAKQQYAFYNAAKSQNATNGNANDLNNRTGFQGYEANYYQNQESFPNTLTQQSVHAQPFNMKHKPVEYNYALPSNRIKTESKSFSILSGDPESPELNPNSNPWAPSEAALAYSNQLAAAAKATPAFELATHGLAVDSTDNTEEECEMNQSFEGLGFDPTENMDTFIMSPSIRSSADDDHILDFHSLTLNPDLNANVPANDLKPFALTSPSRLLDASTWSTAGLTGRSPARIGATIGGVQSTSSTALNWNLLPESTKSPPPSTNVTSTAASFLSLSPLSSHRDGVINWGTHGGLGGIDITSLSMRQQQAKESKDTSE